jgi:hypothetical protein
MTPIKTERRDKWATYELYKRRIAATATTPEEYHRRITALAERLGV